MKPHYKLRLKDIVPYRGIAEYADRNKIMMGHVSVIPMEDKINYDTRKAMLRVKILKSYNLVFGVGISIVLPMNEQTIKSGLEYLVARIVLKN